MATRVKPLVEISIQEPFRGKLSRPWLRKVASHAIGSASPGEPCLLSLVIADDDTLRRLNKQYRGAEEVTDVLAFSPIHQGHWAGDGEAPVHAEEPLVVAEPTGDRKFMGEVIISYPQAARQSSHAPLGLEKELALLIVHGLLHLLGYDHAQPDEEAAMQAKERSILGSLSLDRLPGGVGKAEGPRVGAP